MKTLITLITSAVLTFLTSYVFAGGNPDPVKFAKVETIIDHFIDVTYNGNTELVDYLFTDDFYQSTPNNRNNETITKRKMVKYLKSLKGIKMNCNVDYQFVENNDDCSIVKITSRFSNFERNDYVTLCNSKDGWRISNVVVTYP